MGERRVSGWFILSAVFIVLVFGLFFTFTERKTWPEHKVDLAPMDMRLVPPVSTLWCEAVALHSDHYFVAYRVNHSGHINPLRLTSQIVSLGRKRLGRNWNTNFEEHRYFLLPSSVVEILACSAFPGVKLLLFKGHADVLDCLQKLHKMYFTAPPWQEKYSKPMDYESYEDFYSDEDDDYSDEDDLISGHSVEKDNFIDETETYKKTCSSLLHFASIDVNDDEDSADCSLSTKLHLFKMNISSADYYTIVLWNSDLNLSNYVNLRVMLDRTRYVIHRSGQPLDICSLSNSCTIGLSFASGDRVLVTFPEDPHAGRSIAVIRSRCKPRLAVFAVLSVFLPLLLFLTVAFIVRADKQICANFFRIKRGTNTRLPNNQRVVSPLLDDRTASSVESIPSRDIPLGGIASVQIDDMPPPYHTLYDPPPPYACVKDKQQNNEQSR